MSRSKQVYHDYINSPQWAAIRQAYLIEYGRDCKRCGKIASVIEVHHHVYYRFGGRELMSDLVGLCLPCHELVHEFHRRQKPGYSLTRATEKVCGIKLVRVRKKPLPRQPNAKAWKQSMRYRTQVPKKS